jgi:hypothetical protein
MQIGVFSFAVYNMLNVNARFVMAENCVFHKVSAHRLFVAGALNKFFAVFDLQCVKYNPGNKKEVLRMRERVYPRCNEFRSIVLATILWATRRRALRFLLQFSNRFFEREIVPLS